MPLLALVSASLKWDKSNSISLIGPSLVAQMIKNLPANAGDTQVEKQVERESCFVVSDSAIPWTTWSMEFSRPEYWSG